MLFGWREVIVVSKERRWIAFCVFEIVANPASQPDYFAVLERQTKEGPQTNGHASEQLPARSEKVSIQSVCFRYKQYNTDRQADRLQRIENPVASYNAALMAASRSQQSRKVMQAKFYLLENLT